MAWGNLAGLSSVLQQFFPNKQINRAGCTYFCGQKVKYFLNAITECARIREIYTEDSMVNGTKNSDDASASNLTNAPSITQDRSESNENGAKGTFVSGATPDFKLFQGDIDERIKTKWNENILKYGWWVITVIFAVILTWFFQQIWTLNTTAAILKEKIDHLEKTQEENDKKNSNDSDFWNNALKQQYFDKNYHPPKTPDKPIKSGTPSLLDRSNKMNFKEK